MIGPANSGSNLHFHIDAWNALVLGKKKWFLFPPSYSSTSSLHPKTWYHTIYPHVEHPPFGLLFSYFFSRYLFLFFK